LPEITCSRCGQTREAAGNASYAGELGDRIRRKVCGICWQEWLSTQIILINEYRLNLGLEEHREALRNKMKEFLKLG